MQTVIQASSRVGAPRMVRRAGAKPAAPVVAPVVPRRASTIVAYRNQAPGYNSANGRSTPSSDRTTPTSSNPSSTSSNPSTQTDAAALVPSIFGAIEDMIERSLSTQLPGHRSDWQEVEGNWVLRPPNGAAPEAVVHFLGGAFVGAAPQLSYRLFLEALASRNVMVITTPFGTSFDHLRIADEVQYKFDRCCQALQTEVGRLPVYGCGHSLGSLLHLLISARYSTERDGNALLAFNNRPATDSIPFLSPLIAPSARAVGPLLAQLAASPFRPTVEAISDTMRGLSPSLVRQLLPLVEQLTPIYMDVAQGRQEFSPAPEETSKLIRNYYGVSKNLLLRFKDDNIDETLELATLLQGSSAISSSLDVTVRTLPGDHVRPMQQAIVDLPPEVARMANQAVATGGSLIGRLADMASQMGVQQVDVLDDLSKGVTNMAAMLGGQVGGPVTDGMQALADEVAAWMGVGDVVVKGGKALPASIVVEAVSHE